MKMPLGPQAQNCSDSSCLILNALALVADVFTPTSPSPTPGSVTAEDLGPVPCGQWDTNTVSLSPGPAELCCCLLGDLAQPGCLQGESPRKPGRRLEAM